MKTRPVSRLRCLIIFLIGFMIWAVAVWFVFFLSVNRLSVGIRLAEIPLIWLGIDGVLIFLLYVGHLSSGAPMRRKTPWFVTPWWVKLPMGLTFFPGVLILFFALGIGYSFLYSSPQELPKPSPSYFVDAGQDVFMKRASAERFLKGFVAPQGDGKLIVVDSPVPAGKPFAKATELQAIGDKITPSWGSSIRITEPILRSHLSDRDKNQRPYELRAMVRFPEEPTLRTPILLGVQFSMDCVFAVRVAEEGFVNKRGNVESEQFYVLVGPPGTAKFGSSVRKWGMLAFILFVPTIVLATYFLATFGHLLGFSLPKG